LSRTATRLMVDPLTIPSLKVTQRVTMCAHLGTE
jgi:hypothetical protein